MDLEVFFNGNPGADKKTTALGVNKIMRPIYDVEKCVRTRLQRLQDANAKANTSSAVRAVAPRSKAKGNTSASVVDLKSCKVQFHPAAGVNRAMIS